MATLTDEQGAFARRCHIAVLAACDAAGRSRALPVWYAVEGSAIVIVAKRDSELHRLAAAQPQVSLVIAAGTHPHPTLTIQARVCVSGDGVALTRSRIAARYLAEPDLTTHLEARGERDWQVIRLEPRSAISSDAGDFAK